MRMAIDSAFSPISYTKKGTVIISSGDRELDLRREGARVSVPVTRDLTDVSLDTSVIRIDRHTRNLNRLAELPALRRIVAGGIDQRILESLAGAASIEELSVTGSAIETFAPLRQLTRLVWMHVSVATRLRSLSGIERHPNLTFLEVRECASLRDLEPAQDLQQLRLLTLDGRMYKPMRLDSLEPLGRLSSLRVLRLSAVRIRDRDLSPLFGLTGLQWLELPRHFSPEQFAELSWRLPHAKGAWRRWVPSP